MIIILNKLTDLIFQMVRQLIVVQPVAVFECLVVFACYGNSLIYRDVEMLFIGPQLQ